MLEVIEANISMISSIVGLRMKNAEFHRDNFVNVDLSPSCEEFFRTNSKERITKDDGMILCAIVEDQPVGFLVTNFLGDHPVFDMPKTLLIEDMYIDEAHRGKGIGKALVKEIVNRFPDTAIKLFVYPSNEKAYCFWKSVGAEVEHVKMALTNS